MTNAVNGRRKLAALQMASGPDREANLAEARRLLEIAADAGAGMAVLPEYFAQFGLSEKERTAAAEKDGDGPVQQFMAKAAGELGLWIVGGSIPVQTDGKRTRGACMVYDDSGDRVARYDKLHLFDVHVPERDEHYEESGWTEPGEPMGPIDTPFGRLGVAICYDLRFPELFRWQSAQDVDIFALPAAFTAATGRAHWEVLLRARAIENLAYVVAAGQGGYHANGRETWGHSMVVDPWGTVMDEIARGNGVASGTPDLERLQKTRRSFPVLGHRRDIF
ncbi:MAG: carbon-nitrogen hydrolase family protein [Gammaproteobacteria bacterium]|nr:carbon-nitrogen hydrolase family protein [Gammaproteobacteria bacterium]